MALRRLTTEEIKQLATRVTQADRYEAIEKYTYDYYGSRAHLVRVKIDSYYNDEYYKYNIESIRVYDKAGERLYPDFALPKVQPYLRRINKSQPIGMQKEDLEEIFIDVHLLKDTYNFALPEQAEDDEEEEVQEFLLDNAFDPRNLVLYIEESEPSTLAASDLDF